MKPIEVAGRDLDAFMSHVLRNTVIKFQENLGGKLSPIDTGRFRSNWFASHGTNEQTTEDLDSPQTDAQQLQLDWRKQVNLVNNLPYAERLCFGNYAVSRPKNWFEAYFNSRGQKVVDAAMRSAEENL